MEQREIKFRAWNRVDKHGMIDLKKITPLATTVIDGLFLPFDENIVLMQYTGLKDKNGKEIYEGDVYHQGDPNIKYVVEWIDCGLKGRQTSNQSSAGITHWLDRIEVIGNIHQNPELLNQ